MHKNKNSPLISVLICYYKKDILKKCIDSICKQTYPNIEIIIVDDGNNSKYKRILYNAIRNRKTPIRILINKTNKGIGFSRNRLLNEYRGDACIFIDSDDTFKQKGAIMYMYKASNSLDYDIVMGNHHMRSGPIKSMWWNKHKCKSTSNLLRVCKCFSALFIWNNLYSKKFLNRYKLIRPLNKKNNNYCEDMIAILLLITAKKFIFINKITYLYNLNRNSTSYISNVDSRKIALFVENFNHCNKIFNYYKNKINDKNKQIFFKWMNHNISFFFYLVSSCKQLNSEQKYIYYKKMVKNTKEWNKIKFKTWWRSIFNMYVYTKLFNSLNKEKNDELWI